jgi:chorismate synthase
MSGNSFGQLFRVTTFGESHGDALKKELKRRAPGQHAVHTSRKEEDLPEILSGVFQGKTLGTPITVIVRNTNQKSEDYEALKDQYRPGHADQTTMMKYGFRDHRGGGRASGRETLARVIGGYFAGLILPKVSFYAYIEEVGHLKLTKKPESHSVDRGEINVPEKKLSDEIVSFLKECKEKGESAGGIVTLSILNSPTGLGEPVFDKLKAEFAKAMLSLPACTGFSVGPGFEMTKLPGSVISQDPSHFGGMEGGISNGKEIVLKMAFKAPSTIGEKAKAGRHDPCILPRVVPVVEAMAKIVMADHFLRQSAYDSFRP